MNVLDKYIQKELSYAKGDSGNPSLHPWRSDSDIRMVRISLREGITREWILSKLVGSNYLVSFEKGTKNRKPHCHILCDVDIIKLLKEDYPFVSGNGYYASKKDFSFDKLEQAIKYVIKEDDFQSSGFAVDKLQNLQRFKKADQGFKDDIIRLRDEYMSQDSHDNESVAKVYRELVNIYKKYFIEFRRSDLEKKVISWTSWCDKEFLENQSRSFGQNFFFYKE